MMGVYVLPFHVRRIPFSSFFFWFVRGSYIYIRCFSTSVGGPRAMCDVSFSQARRDDIRREDICKRENDGFLYITRSHVAGGGFIYSRPFALSIT